MEKYDNDWGISSEQLLQGALAAQARGRGRKSQLSLDGKYANSFLDCINALADELNSSGDARDELDWDRYARDPVAFGEEILGEFYPDDIKDLFNSVRDNRVTIARSCTGFGKSFTAARIALWFYLCFPNACVYTAAAPPERNLRGILWGELNTVIYKHRDLLLPESKYRITDLRVTRRDNEKSVIEGLTIPMTGSPAEKVARFSGKHAPCQLFIFDEGDAIPEEVYTGTEGCLSGGLIQRVLIMFNPRHESGYVARLISEKKANVVELNAFRHPNVITGEQVIPGAVDRDTTVRRINDWTVELGEYEHPDSECFEVPDFLVGFQAEKLGGIGKYPPLPGGWRRIIEPAFSYMVLGKYPAAGEGQLISRAWVNAARSRWDAYVAQNGVTPPRAVRPILGLDVAELGQDLNVLTLRYGGWVAMPEMWNNVDPLETADKAADRFHNRECIMACVDGTGVGAGVAPQMERLDCTDVYGVKVASRPTFEIETGKFHLLRDQLYWLMREWLRTDKGAMLPPNDRLIEELTTPTYDNVNGEIRVMDKKRMKEALGRSPDFAESLMLTFYNEAIDGEDPNGALAKALSYRGNV